MDKKLKAVLCGATFGQFYMEALSRLSEKFEVVGLIARGSEKSRKCADFYNVPLFTSADEVPEDTDIAFVILRSGILGGVANDYVKYFLERKIHVFQEFPVHPKDAEENFKLSLKNKVCYCIGDFYVKLPQIRNFISRVKELNEICPPSHIQLGCSSAVSFPAVMMLREMLPSAKNTELKCLSENETPFQIIAGKIDNIPLTAEVHNETNTKDPDSAMYLLQSFNVIYENGRLSLQDPFGGICWYSKVKSSAKRYESGAVARLSGGNSADGCILLSMPEKIESQQDMTEIWIGAIISDINDMLESIENKNFYIKKSQWELSGIKFWDKFSKITGFPKRIDGEKASAEQKKLLDSKIAEWAENERNKAK